MEDIKKTLINWYPGHMKKHFDLTKRNVNSFNVFLFVLDARCPLSSIHPDLKKILKNKHVIYVIVKDDLADPKITKLWREYFDKNYPNQYLFANLKNRKIWPDVRSLILKKIKLEHRFSYHKIMVVGVPNVGKSSLINNLSNKKSARVQNRPGLTQAFQNIKIDDNFEICDTPGLLWPKFENDKISLNLSIINSIKRQVLPLEEVVEQIFNFFKEKYPKEFAATFKCETSDLDDYLKWLNIAAQKFGFYLKGQEINYDRLYNHVFNVLQDGKKIRFSLESPIK
ncbi:hypothetical protein ASO20_00595 [Mycoplasma sp. (ex Biomphalaria glabrata)]|uniref:ribosome biogenesis GTPase YlqF n=1 Tax=Mycoplasma sp. (ex Biomphalaria glabrata) TaxID=1749074 RepID=UPI00073AB07C|nr:ribosome biogenesis GTPase YlqF [Mycoplasma sp. (ex Biomphalaria glabrata)]ALV23175.1 hypothetical protein ASO20_00595 [Mycoplasma sp. (ex Biomphalaria glabrata)]